MMTSIAEALDVHADSIRLQARNAAEVMTKRVFAERGNHSEVHLSRVDLAMILAVMAEAALPTRLPE